MSKNLRVILIIGGLLMLGFTIWYLSNIVIYILISFVLSLIGRPIMNKLGLIRMKGKMIPDWIRSGIVILLFTSILLGIVGILVPVVNKEVQLISSIDVKDVLSRNQEFFLKIEEYGERLNIRDANIEYLKAKLSSYLDFSFFGNLFTEIIAKIGNLLVAVGSIMFITYFLLKDGNIVNNIVHSLTPDPYLPGINNIMTETRELLSRYFTGLLIQITLFSLMIWGGLSILHIQNAILLGLLAGLLNVIPYVGPLIGGAIGIVLGTTANLHLDFQLELLPLILKIAAVFSVAQILDNFIFSPLIYSTSVKAHPLEIFMVVLIAGTVSGIIGMIVAVPFYTFLRIVAKEFFQGYKVVQGLTRDL